MSPSTRGKDATRRPFWLSVPVILFTTSATLVAVGVGIFLAPEVDDQRLLARGNDAFRRGDWKEAIELYGEDGEKVDLYTRKFNLALAQRKSGLVDAAIARFEEVSTDGEEELRPLALHMLGKCHFEKGEAEYKAAFESPESPSDQTPEQERSPPPSEKEVLEARQRKLTDAEASFQRSAEFLRDIEPRGEDAEHDLQVAKAALRQTKDEIARIREELRRLEEDDSLSKPHELLPKLLATEKRHRLLARGASQHGGRERRLASRGLRRAQAENRQLTDRLANYLAREIESFEKQDPNAEPKVGVPGTPQLTPEQQKNRIEGFKLAVSVVKAAVEAQREAEISYSNLAPEKAVEFHATAIEKLREARGYIGLDAFALAREAHQIQEQLLEISKRLDEAKSAGLSGEIEGSGVGKTVVQTLKDRVLQPLARLLTPSQQAELELVSEELDEVVWAADLLARRKVPPSRFESHVVQDAEGGAKASAEDLAKAFNTLLREQAPIARDAATQAKSLLDDEKLPAGIAEEEKSLAALARIVEGLPEEPEQPKSVQERLEELLGRQLTARDATAGLPDLDEDARLAAGQTLVASQSSDADEAESIAGELEASPGAQGHAAGQSQTSAQDKLRKEAAGLVKAAASQIVASSISLEEGSFEKAQEAIELDVKYLQEALEALQNEEQNEEDQQQEQQKKDEGGYTLKPREADALKEEMDRKRREALRGIYRPDDSFTVEKDW